MNRTAAFVAALWISVPLAAPAGTLEMRTLPPPPPVLHQDWSFDDRPPVALRLLKSSAFHAPLRLADLLSTEVALGRPGLHERNPFGRTRGTRIVLVAAASAGTTWLDHKWANKKKARWALRITHGLLTAWVVQHNMGHAARAGR